MNCYLAAVLLSEAHNMALRNKTQQQHMPEIIHNNNSLRGWQNIYMCILCGINFHTFFDTGQKKRARAARLSIDNKERSKP